MVYDLNLIIEERKRKEKNTKFLIKKGLLHDEEIIEQDLSFFAVHILGDMK